MSPTNSVYISGPPLDPPDDIECDWCENYRIMIDADENEVPCHYCQCDNDPGEPNDPPEE